MIYEPLDRVHVQDEKHDPVIVAIILEQKKDQFGGLAYLILEETKEGVEIAPDTHHLFCKTEPRVCWDYEIADKIDSITMGDMLLSSNRAVREYAKTRSDEGINISASSDVELENRQNRINEKLQGLDPNSDKDFETFLSNL